MIPAPAHPYIIFVLGTLVTLFVYLWRRGETADKADRDAMKETLTAMRADFSQMRTDMDASEKEVLRLFSALPQSFVTRQEQQATNATTTARLDRIDDKLDRLLARTLP